MTNETERWYSLKEIMEPFGVSRDTVLGEVKMENFINLENDIEEK